MCRSCQHNAMNGTSIVCSKGIRTMRNIDHTYVKSSIIEDHSCGCQQNCCMEREEKRNKGCFQKRKRCLESTISLGISDLLDCTERTSILISSVKKQKTTPKIHKQVRFSTTSDGEQIVATVIEYRPLCSEFTSEEKMQLWVQPSEQFDIRTMAKTEVQQFFRMPQLALPFSQAAFIKAFSYAYQSSKNVSSSSLTDKSDKDIDDSDTMSLSSSQAVLSMLQCAPDLLPVLASAEVRGLEDRIIPIIGIDRRIVRKRIIQTVAATSKSISSQRKQIFDQLHHLAEQQPDQEANKINGQDTLLRSVDTFGENVVRSQYENFSFSARFFAEAVGLIDATAAMIEYSSSQSIMNSLS
jgi:hypothetical protein